MIASATGPQPADLADVRAANLAVVLRFVREHAPCSRADIAASTGLNKATVSSLVADLIDRRLVRETGLTTETRIGRPATMLVLDGSPYAAAGIEINVDHVTAVAVDLAGQRLMSSRQPFAGALATPAQAIDAVTALARRALTCMAAEHRQVLGLAVAIPGLVDIDGRVLVAPNLGWQDVDLAGDLINALHDPGFPIRAENDANLGALAEQRFGPFGRTGDLVYLTGQVGVGAGVIMDGRLRRGTRGYGGEIGHIQVDTRGPKCRCGQVGCLEAVAGVGTLVGGIAPGGPVSPSDLDNEVQRLVRNARAGDRETLSLLGRVGTDLGAGVAILANLLNPEVVVLGGYFVPLAPWLLPVAEAEMRRRAIAPDAGGTRLVASTLGYDAAALGGAARVLDAVDSGRLPHPAGVAPAG